MALLSEFAITPDVFDSACYMSGELCGVHLQMLKNVLMDQGLVRDLRDGKWSSHFALAPREWHPRGKEIRTKLAAQRRLVRFKSILPDEPADDAAWCAEAVATDGSAPLTGIVTSAATALQFPGNASIASVEKLGSKPWWPTGACSVRTTRQMADYVRALDLMLRHSNSLMLIDPHLRPSKPKYSQFAQLLTHSGSRSPSPLIELHRVCYEGSGATRNLLSITELQTEFQATLSAAFIAAGLTCKVFIWDDFHDRYVISNLAGISVSNGFDTSADPNARVTWTRLSREDRDEVQREFDSANTVHKLRHSFSLP
jgi:hypothetical protein